MFTLASRVAISQGRVNHYEQLTFDKSVIIWPI